MVKLNLSALWESSNTTQSPLWEENKTDIPNIPETKKMKITLESVQFHTSQTSPLSDNTVSSEQTQIQNSSSEKISLENIIVSPEIQQEETKDETKTQEKTILIQDADTEVSFKTHQKSELFSNYTSSYDSEKKQKIQKTPLQNLAPEKKDPIISENISQSNNEPTKKSKKLYIITWLSLCVMSLWWLGIYFHGNNSITGNLQESSNSWAIEVLQTNETQNVNTNTSTFIDNNEKKNNIVSDEVKQHLIDKYKSKYQSN